MNNNTTQQAVNLALAEAERKNKAGKLINTISGPDFDFDDLNNYKDGDPESVYTIISLYSETEEQEEAISNALMEKYPDHFPQPEQRKEPTDTMPLWKKLNDKKDNDIVSYKEFNKLASDNMASLAEALEMVKNWFKNYFEGEDNGQNHFNIDQVEEALSKIS